MFLNINADASVIFTNKLEKYHRSGLPKAIRETLNEAALDMKKNTMPDSARSAFDDRTNTNFFKANSRVNFARGWDVSKMKAVVGFVDNKLKGSNNEAVSDLEQQESGGVIKGRAFVPLKRARVSNSFKRVTKRKFRIADIKGKIIDSKRSRGDSDKQKWIKSAIFAGQGGLVIGNKVTAKGNRIVFGIRKIGSNASGTWVKADPLFAVKGKRQVRVSATRFVANAANKTSGKIESLYIANAKAVIKKLKKR